MMCMSRLVMWMFLLLAFVSASIALAADQATPESLTFEQRVSCFEAIEDVYWSHRIWPMPTRGRNPIATNSFPARRSPPRWRGRCCRKRLSSTCWVSLWHHIRFSGSSTGSPRAHSILGSWRMSPLSLDNDPALIAECFVRPRLVERLLHQNYAWDPALHRDLRDRALNELSEVGFLSDLVSTSAEVTEIAWVRVDGSVPESVLADDEVVLDPNEWSTATGRLAGRFPTEIVDEPGGSTPDDAAELVASQAGQGVSPLFETAEGFAVVEILESTSGRLRVASATWPKRGVADWLKVISDRIGPADPVAGLFVLPELKAGQPCHRRHLDAHTGKRFAVRPASPHNGLDRHRSDRVGRIVSTTPS